MGLPPVQTPLTHLSVWVQPSPSLHAVSSGRGGSEQLPLLGSQTPAKWQSLEAGHVLGLAPMQMPFWQVSLCVQALASLQAVSFGCSGLEHWPLLGSQTPFM